MNSLRYGSLFSGCGGLDLGLEATIDATCAWHSEVNPQAAATLARHWPGVPNHGDITAIDWATIEPVDILVGGFPCQDISAAGQRAGIKEGTRSGLWYRYADAIRVLRPRLVFVENVSALAIRGLDAVLTDLANLGYDTEWACLQAAAVGAPHRRERLFILAWPSGHPPSGWWRPSLQSGDPHHHQGPPRSTDPRPVPDAHRPRLQGTQRPQRARGDHRRPTQHRRPPRYAPGWQRARLQQRRRQPLAPRVADRPPVPTIDWGRYTTAIRRWEHTLGRPAPYPTNAPRRLAAPFVEWMMGYPAGWVTEHQSNGAALRQLGNGVVPLQSATALDALLERAAS